MRISIATGLVAAVSVQAFSDSSPFLLFSTSQFQTPKGAQLQSNKQVVESARDVTSPCPTNRYLIIAQPNLHSTDLRGSAGCQSPNLCRALDGDGILGRITVAEVIGDITPDDFSEHIRLSCQKKGRDAKIDEHRLPPLPAQHAERARALADNDIELGHLLAAAQNEGDYTVIYFSSGNEAQPYEPEIHDGSHVELKRQIGSSIVGRRKGNSTDTRPLFEKYQFFTPGIFMGLLAFFTILTIMYVGLAALGSLQVPYGAFEKDMGPAAQKKQQ